MKKHTKETVSNILQVIVILLNIAGILGIWNILRIVYPKLYLFPYIGPYSIVPFFTTGLLILPAFSAIILYYFQKKHKEPLLAVSAGMIPATLIICTLSFISFFFLPPVCSYTCNEENYLIVDEKVQEYSQYYETFLPGRIPDSAVNIKYKYKAYEAFFSQELSIYASWKLSSTEYEFAKKNILEESEDAGISSGGVICITEADKKKHIPEMIFTYDDSTQQVSYSVSLERSL